MSYFYTTIDADATAGRIKELRKSAGMTVRQVANYMGFEEPQAVYKWESAKSLPSLDNLVVLAGMYQTTLDSIIVTKQILIRERDDSSLSFFEPAVDWRRIGGVI